MEWRMHAHRVERHGRVDYEHLAPDPRYATSHGLPYPVVQVTVTEDADGPYYGWIDTSGTPRAERRDAMPVMIQPHRTLFRMQFPYGVDAEVDAGKGRVVRLRVEEVA